MRSQPLFSNDRTYGNSTLTLHQYKKNPECQFYIFIQFHSECCLPSVTGPVGTITWQGRVNGGGGGARAYPVFDRSVNPKPGF